MLFMLFTSLWPDYTLIKWQNVDGHTLIAHLPTGLSLCALDPLNRAQTQVMWDKWL